MGTTPSLQLMFQHFPPQKYQWKAQGQSKSQNLRMSPLIVHDLAKNLIGEKYAVTEFQSLSSELDIFLFRKQNSMLLVDIYDIVLHQKPSPVLPDCMKNQNNSKFQVVLQRIPYRLADIGVIHFKQMIYILQQCFRALHLMWVQYGKNFYIDQDYICFNLEGKCKIWVNDKLYKNSSNIQASFHSQTIIRQILQILEGRVCDLIPEYYRMLKQSLEHGNFSQALILVQKTKKKFGISIDHIQSLKVQTTKENMSGSQRVQSAKSIKKGNSVAKKANAKFSLKNSRNLVLNKQKTNLMASVSKEHTTQVSFSELQRVGKVQDEFQDDANLRSTFKSVKGKRSDLNTKYTEYSQKCKRKLSRSKNPGDQGNKLKESSNIKVNLNFY